MPLLTIRTELWWMGKLSMSPQVTSGNWPNTYFNSKPYQVYPSFKLLPLSTKRHSAHIRCIGNTRNFILTIVFFFLSPYWWHLFRFCLMLPYTFITPEVTNALNEGKTGVDKSTQPFERFNVKFKYLLPALVLIYLNCNSCKSCCHPFILDWIR